MSKQPDLIPVPESLSPRLQWERAYGIATHGPTPGLEYPWIAVSMVVCRRFLEGYELTEEEKLRIGPMMASYCRLVDEADLVGYGRTRDDAIDYLVRRGVVPSLETWRLWKLKNP